MLSELRSLAHLTGGVRHRDEGQVWAEGGGQADDAGEQAHGSQTLFQFSFLSFACLRLAASTSSSAPSPS